MKKNILFGFFLLTSSVTYAQLTVNAKKLTVSDSLRIDSTTIRSISNDTSSQHKDSTALITEWAAKKYADGHGSRGVSSLSDSVKTFFNPNSWWYNSSMAIGANLPDEHIQYLAHNNDNLGFGNLMISPNLSNNPVNLGWWNTMVGSMLIDNVGGLNTLIGNMPEGSVGEDNCVVTSLNTNWGGMSYGNRNSILGGNIRSAGSNNILIGYSTGVQGDISGNNQINIGNSILKDSLGHYALNNIWPESGVGVDLGSTITNGGTKITSGTTAQRLALVASEGLFFYDKTIHALCVYNGSSWQKMPTASAD